MFTPDTIIPHVAHAAGINKHAHECLRLPPPEAPLV
jgi:hypothetical protein